MHERWLAACLARAIYAMMMCRSKRLSDPIVGTWRPMPRLQAYESARSPRALGRRARSGPWRTLHLGYRGPAVVAAVTARLARSHQEPYLQMRKRSASAYHFWRRVCTPLTAFTVPEVYLIGNDRWTASGRCSIVAGNFPGPISEWRIRDLLSLLTTRIAMRGTVLAVHRSSRGCR